MSEKLRQLLKRLSSASSSKQGILLSREETLIVYKTYTELRTKEVEDAFDGIRSISRRDIHVVPNQDDINMNLPLEPEGEHIRAELVDFLTRNKIVNIVLDTEKHCVNIDIIRLPPEIKPVLTSWGSIYVCNEMEK